MSGYNSVSQKVVLVRPNYNTHIITPPLGIGYLSSFLKHNGIDVVVIDALRDRLSPSDVIKQISEIKPDIVGITCLTDYYLEVVSIAHLVKKAGIRCIIGGVHPTFLPYSTLKDTQADFVICGEGEQALTKLCQNNFDHSSVQGVYSLGDLSSDKDKIARAEPVEDISELPFPDWDQIHPGTYPKAPHGAIVKNYPVAPVMTSRGCPYECTFCASPQFYNRKVRFRTVDNVIDELKILVEKYHVKEIHFEDDNLTLKRSYVVELCEKIISNGLHFSWACPNGIRADSVDKPLLELMAKSGCYYFSYGIESADSEILKNIKKLETIETIEKSIAMADDVGITCQGFFIFGLPGENKKTIQKNIDFSRKSRLSRAQFLILDVLPGSELWETLGGKFTPNWNKNSYKEPEWIPEGLSADCLRKAQEKAFWNFYLRPSIIFKMLKYVRFDQIKYLLDRVISYRILKLK